MRILLSNDDGYTAPGIRMLHAVLSQQHEVTIVAPDQDRSGASNSLTLDRPLRAVEAEENIYRVNGTPTDCVHLAITGLLAEEPDMVISGINAGPNLGDDVLYSGTVAAAMELFEMGAITTKETDGVEFKFGSAEALAKAAEWVATGRVTKLKRLG